MTQKKLLNIGITMGDPNGIGPEVLLRALKEMHPFNGWTPLIFGDMRILMTMNDILRTSFKFYEISENNLTLRKSSLKEFYIPVIDLSVKKERKWEHGNCNKWGGESAFKFVIKAIKYAKQKKINAIVTAPISKHALVKAGHFFSGHTEILAHFCNVERSVMMLAVDELRATMVTLHISLRQAIESLSKEIILEVIEITNAGLKKMGISEPVLGIAGLNPHAGENKLFGDEEYRIIRPAIDIANKKGINCIGPFPPDTIFLEHKKGLFDVVVAHYHDQALGPLKLYGFDRAVNITLGIPIIRTSPDHGTAFELAPEFKANPTSMIEAIKLAIKMSI
tara:strand:+ start:1082 stop:2089 length:1008 start_codon:yes stop_codon:yes gene_type:complete